VSISVRITSPTSRPATGVPFGEWRRRSITISELVLAVNGTGSDGRSSRAFRLGSIAVDEPTLWWVVVGPPVP
jgi:hypothetical protein